MLDHALGFMPPQARWMFFALFAFVWTVDAATFVERSMWRAVPGEVLEADFAARQRRGVKSSALDRLAWTYAVDGTAHEQGVSGRALLTYPRHGDGILWMPAPIPYPAAGPTTVYVHPTNAGVSALKWGPTWLSIGLAAFVAALFALDAFLARFTEDEA